MLYISRGCCHRWEHNYKMFCNWNRKGFTCASFAQHVSRCSIPCFSMFVHHCKEIVWIFRVVRSVANFKTVRQFFGRCTQKIWHISREYCPYFARSFCPWKPIKVRSRCFADLPWRGYLASVVDALVPEFSGAHRQVWFWHKTKSFASVWLHIYFSPSHATIFKPEFGLSIYWWNHACGTRRVCRKRYQRTSITDHRWVFAWRRREIPKTDCECSLHDSSYLWHKTSWLSDTKCGRETTYQYGKVSWI